MGVGLVGREENKGVFLMGMGGFLCRCVERVRGLGEDVGDGEI